MAEEMVVIGCRLPNGYTLEVGLQTTVRGGPQNGLLPKVERTASYKRIKLKGTHWHHAALFRMGMRPPSVLNPEPFINQVPKEFWERWKKEHPNAIVLKDGSITEMTKTDGASIKAATLDVMARPAVLTPMDPAKPMTVGKDVVETADFGEK